MLFVQHINARAFRDIGSGHNARTFGLDRQALGAFDFHADRNAFEVQDDVGDIFTNTSNA